MVLVAITRIRNEADIIEAFIRHHVVLFDQIIVTDDGSTDGTAEILQKLKEEGMPLLIQTEPTFAYPGSGSMTRMMRKAFDELGADWVTEHDDALIALSRNAGEEIQRPLHFDRGLV